jgi:hypothetical protein
MELNNLAINTSPIPDDRDIPRESGGLVEVLDGFSDIPALLGTAGPGEITMCVG